jgi:hypothetical protein
MVRLFSVDSMLNALIDLILAIMSLLPFWNKAVDVENLEGIPNFIREWSLAI